MFLCSYFGYSTYAVLFLSSFLISSLTVPRKTSCFWPFLVTQPRVLVIFFYFCFLGFLLKDPSFQNFFTHNSPVTSFYHWSKPNMTIIRYTIPGITKGAYLRNAVTTFHNHVNVWKTEVKNVKMQTMHDQLPTCPMTKCILSLLNYSVMVNSFMSLFLRLLDTLGRFSAITAKGDSFCDFLFA